MIAPEIGAVFAASLLGSVHCVGMCGPFVSVYAGPLETRRSEWLGHLGYQVARGIVYTSLGALAGALGAGLNGLGRAAGAVEIAALLSSLVVVLWGIHSLFGTRLFGKTKPESKFGALLRRPLVQLGKRPRASRGVLLGFLTPLLPCGWLYGFVILAAGTGSALRGAVLLLVFWAGSVPALIGFGALFRRFSTAVRSRFPAFASVLMIVLGLYGLATRVPRLAIFSSAAASDVAPHPSCH